MWSCKIQGRSSASVVPHQKSNSYTICVAVNQINTTFTIFDLNGNQVDKPLSRNIYLSKIGEDLIALGVFISECIKGSGIERDKNIDQPDKSFVYLENQDDLTFLAHYIPEPAYGIWLIMEAGDFNQDGQLDLFLGSYFHTIEEWTRLLHKSITSFPEVLLLMNTNPGMK